MVGGVERGDSYGGSLEVMLASASIEDTGTKGRSMLMGFAAGTVLGLWEHKVG